MANALLGWKNHAESATLDGGLFSSSFPLSNIVSRTSIGKQARTATTAARRMYFRADNGASETVGAGSLSLHTLSANAQWRLMGGASPLPVPAKHYDFLSNALPTGITLTHSTTSNYFDTSGELQSAAIDAARFDHTPYTGKRKGLLVEPGRTNLITYSEDFTQWTATRAVIVSNVATGSDGELTADLLKEDGTGSNTHSLASNSISFTSGTAYAFAIDVEPAGRPRVVIEFPSAAFPANVSATFDVVNGAVDSAGAGLDDSGIIKLPNGRFRVWAVATADATTSGTVTVTLDDGSSTSYDGDTLSGVYLWGAQVEAGEYPTSYKATSGSSAARGAESVTVTGASFSTWHQNGAGTVFVEFEATNGAADQQGVLALSDGTTDNEIRLSFDSSGNLDVDVASGGTAQAAIDTTEDIVEGKVYRVALAFDGDDFAVSVGGADAVTDTSGLVPFVNQLVIGALGDGTAVGSLWFREVRYYTERLSDAVLKAMTNRGATINADFSACAVDLPDYFTHSRASGGTYIDSKGRVAGYAPAKTLPIVPQTTKQERVKNGTFASDELWTKGTGWTIGSGVATKSAGTGSSLTQTVPTIPGQVYRVRFNVSSFSAGTLALDVAGTDLLTGIAATGTQTATFTATGNTSTVNFEGDSAFAGSVDNVSVTLDTGLRIPVGANQDWKVGRLVRLDPQDGTSNTYMLGKVIAYSGSILTVDVIEAAAPELISNGHFTSATTGWTAHNSASLSVSSSRLRVTENGSVNPGARQTLSAALTIGSTYLVDADAFAGTASSGARVQLSGTFSDVAAGSGRVVFDRVATATSEAVSLFALCAAASGQYSDFDNLSVKRAHTDWIVSLAGPRFQYDTSGTALGLLVEESRTNLIADSEAFENWTTNNASVSANVALAPTGSIVADKIVEDATASKIHRVAQNIILASGTKYTVSVYAKAAERSFLRLEFDYGSSGSTVWFDLANGAVGTVVGSPDDSGIESCGDGWYRCWIVDTADATGASPFFLYGAPSDGVSSWDGDGASGIYVFGAQAEAGAFPTSYIPTFGVSRTRAADVCTVEGDEFTARYRQDEGAFYYNFAPNGFISSMRALVVDNGGTSDYIALTFGSGDPDSFRWDVVDASSAQAQFTLESDAVAGTAYAAALAVKANDFAAVLDGGTVATDASGTMPTVDRMGVGSVSGIGGNPLSGTISRLIYWPERLSDATLQAITTSGADLDFYTQPGGLSDAVTATTDTGWMSVWPTGYTPANAAHLPKLARKILSASVTHRYWFIEIIDPLDPESDQTTGDDGLQIGVGYFGLWETFQPGVNITPDPTERFKSRTVVQETLNGAQFFDRRTPNRQLDVGYRQLTDAEDRTARKIKLVADTAAPVLFSYDPDATDWLERDMLATLAELSDSALAFVGRSDLHATGFKLKEIIG